MTVRVLHLYTLLIYVSWVQAVVHNPKFFPAVRVRTVIVTLHVRVRLFISFCPSTVGLPGARGVSVVGGFGSLDEILLETG